MPSARFEPGLSRAELAALELQCVRGETSLWRVCPSHFAITLMVPDPPLDGRTEPHDEPQLAHQLGIVGKGTERLVEVEPRLRGRRRAWRA